MLAQEVIRRKRDGQRLDAAQIQSFVDGLVDGQWSEGQVAALAMAVLWRGMEAEECALLTRAMARSGDTLQWLDLPGPVLDKHSSGGVGDKVSLMLAPLVAACGGYVPMISGRGLGHTGGTLDKLDAIPGYQSRPGLDQLRAVLPQAGCAIIGQTDALAPADRRLYAVRDVTATVESVPLITASILSKKLAAGLQGLVMDIKCGNGAFAADLATARALATSIRDVATAAGLPTRCQITDMNQVLGREAGNALEVMEAIRFLRGDAMPQDPDGREPRLFEVALSLAADLLCLGGLAADEADARERLQRALDSGVAAERFACMVAGLGGPTDLLERPEVHLPIAPVVRPVPAPQSGRLAGLQTREIGLAVIELGGGRRRATDVIDPRVGFSQVASLGRVLQAGELLAWAHAATEAQADRAVAAFQQACRWQDPGADWQPSPLIIERL